MANAALARREKQNIHNELFELNKQRSEYTKRKITFENLMNKSSNFESVETINDYTTVLEDGRVVNYVARGLAQM